MTSAPTESGKKVLTMAEYIDRGIAIAKLTALEVTDRIATMTSAKRLLADITAADVAPVVRCKDCKYSWEDIGGLCCSHGVCVDLNVPGDFYCAYGERKEKACSTMHICTHTTPVTAMRRSKK